MNPFDIHSFFFSPPHLPRGRRNPYSARLPHLLRGCRSPSLSYGVTGHAGAGRHNAGTSREEPTWSRHHCLCRRSSPTSISTVADLSKSSLASRSIFGSEDTPVVLATQSASSAKRRRGTSLEHSLSQKVDSSFWQSLSIDLIIIINPKPKS